jgi:hypothetical protein
MPFREGCCLKCGKPLFIEIPGKKIGFCPDCKGELAAKYVKDAKKKGKETKDIIFHDPPVIRDE